MLGQGSIWQSVGAEPTYLRDFFADCGRRLVVGERAEEGQHNFTLLWLRVDANQPHNPNVDAHFLADLARHALLDRLARLQPATGQVPPADVAPPRQQKGAIALDDRGAGDAKPARLAKWGVLPLVIHAHSPWRCGIAATLRRLPTPASVPCWRGCPAAPDADKL